MEARLGGFALLCLLGLYESRLVVDLTHTFDKDAPKYPLGRWINEDFNYFKMTTLMEKYIGKNNKTWVALRVLEFYEHQGTHMDSPNHFGNGRWDMSEIPPERLVGPGVVIDVREKVKDNNDYAVSVEDIKLHEADHGRIPPNSIIMMNSGWARHYPNSKLIFGTQNLSDPTTFRFPGWSLEACKFLLTHRQVAVVGVDTPSTDPGSAPEYYCHNFLQPSNVPLLEYVANLDAIPVRGTTIVLGSIKMREGTGGPTRIFALLGDKEDEGFFKGSATVSTATVSLTFLVSILLQIALHLQF